MKSKQFLVLGLGRFGASLAKTLCDLGQEVLAVDADEELVNNIAPYVTQAMQLDATDETLLASLGVKNFDAAIVSIGQNTRDSILVCVLLKELGAPYLVAKANDDLHAKVLRKIGADRVIFPERDMGARLARSIITPNVLELMNLSDDLSDHGDPRAGALGGRYHHRRERPAQIWRQHSGHSPCGPLSGIAPRRPWPLWKGIRFW